MIVLLTVFQIYSCKYCAHTSRSSNDHTRNMQLLPSDPVHKEQAHGISGKLDETNEEKVQVKVARQVTTVQRQAIVGHTHYHPGEVSGYIMT